MERYCILVAEDDKEIRDGIGIYLRNQGYELLLAADGVEGLQMIESNNVHLAVIDIMMPRMDGIMMLMKLRENHEFPVIMLTAKSEEIDKVMGLEMGADDYVTKPFAPMELLARIKSQLRRYTRYLELHRSLSESPPKRDDIFTVGGLELDISEARLTVDGDDVRLTPIEFKILTLLMRNPGRVFSAEEIYERVWAERAVNTDTIMVHVRNIREKIEFNPREPKYLKVVWGIGYKIEKH